MKKCLLVTALIALASVASALTVKWSVGEMTYYGSGNQRIQSALLSGSLVGVGATGSTLTDIVDLANNSANFGNIKEGYTDSLAKLGGTNAQVSGVPSSGKAPYEAIYSGVTLEVGKTYSILFGDAYWYHPNNNTYNYQYLQWAEFTLTQAMLDKVGDTDALHLYVDSVDLKNGSAIAGAEDVLKPTQVPEPTALALLALGVAGLALRRKVA